MLVVFITYFPITQWIFIWPGDFSNMFYISALFTYSYYLYFVLDLSLAECSKTGTLELNIVNHLHYTSEKINYHCGTCKFVKLVGLPQATMCPASWRTSGATCTRPTVSLRLWSTVRPTRRYCCTGWTQTTPAPSSCHLANNSCWQPPAANPLPSRSLCQPSLPKWLSNNPPVNQVFSLLFQVVVLFGFEYPEPFGRGWNIVRPV